MTLKKIFATTLAVAIAVSMCVTAIAAGNTERTKGGLAKQAWSRNSGDQFAKLLENGVITQETLDKIKAYLEKNTPQKAENFVKGERTSMLDELLKAGVITQKDYDALKAGIEAKKAQIKDKSADGEKTQRLNSFLQFVEDGVITQETADAIKAYYKENRPAKSENEQKTERTDLFKKMLDDGVITQQEYDAIKAAMTQRAENFKKQGRKTGVASDDSSN